MVAAEAGNLLDRISSAVSRAVRDAFGAPAVVETVDSGEHAELLAALGGDAQLHMELDAIVGRNPTFPLVVTSRFDAAAAVLGIEAPEVPEDPEEQITLLGQVAGGVDAFASALGAALSTRGAPVGIRVAGTSLERIGESAGTPLFSLADPMALRIELGVPNAPAIAFVVVFPRDLGQALLAEAATSGPGDLSGRSARVAGAATGQPGSGAGAEGISAHPFAFAQLDPDSAPSRGPQSLEPLFDVALHVRVELGAADMVIEDVLALGIGSVVELDRLAGEPVDVLVNNRLIARGEVVVVEESFGVRITEIVRTRGRVSGD